MSLVIDPEALRKKWEEILKQHGYTPDGDIQMKRFSRNKTPDEMTDAFVELCEEIQCDADTSYSRLLFQTLTMIYLVQIDPNSILLENERTKLDATIFNAFVCRAISLNSHPDDINRLFGDKRHVINEYDIFNNEYFLYLYRALLHEYPTFPVDEVNAFWKNRLQHYYSIFKKTKGDLGNKMVAIIHEFKVCLTYDKLQPDLPVYITTATALPMLEIWDEMKYHHDATTYYSIVLEAFTEFAKEEKLEEEAEAAGMTVHQYKEFCRLKEENERLAEQENKIRERQRKAEEKKIYDKAYADARKRVKKKFYITIAIFVAVIAILASLFLYLYIEKTHGSNGEIKELNATIEQLSRENKTLRSDLSKQKDLAEDYLSRLDDLKTTSKEWKKKANFLDAHIVLVTEGGKKYHRYDCYHISGKPFWAYNHEAALEKGYEPCLDCDPPRR